MQIRSILFLVFLPAIGLTQSIDVPRSGFIFDTWSKTFRPVVGVPGAAMLGHDVGIRGELHHVATCSPQRFALAAAGREGTVTLIHLDSLKMSAVSPVLLDAPDQVELSAGCTAAAVYSARANRLQIVTGLPGNPVVAADLTPALPSAVSSLAVSDDGLIVIAAVPLQAVYMVPSTGRPVSLLPIRQDAIVTMRGNQDAVVADLQANLVTLIANVAGSPGVSILAGSDRGINSPTSLWFDSSTETVLVANSGSGTVNFIPLAGGSSTVVECRCGLGRLSPLTDRTYQIQSPGSDQPLMILDVGVSPPRAVFVATPERSKFHKQRDRVAAGTANK